MKLRRTSSRRTSLATIACASLAAAAIGCAPTGHSGGGPPAPTPSNLFAPYVDLSLPDTSLFDQAITRHGLKAFSAAFVQGSDCTPIWGTKLPVTADPATTAKISKARTAGATPVISFGGQAGTELAHSCNDTAALTKAYQTVIDTLDVDHLDFDIEGEGMDNTAVNSRRFAAIKALIQNNPGLVVSYTLPVAPDGLSDKGKNFVRASTEAGVRPDIVNIMTMDYYGTWDTGDIDMGGYAVRAARATLDFLRTLYPDASYKMIGITPMIGQNDAPAEVFTLADAREVAAFAKANGIGRLAFWSVTRDRPCAAASDALYLCSRIDQRPLAFTDVFAD